MDSTVKVSFAMVMITKSFILQVFSFFCVSQCCISHYKVLIKYCYIVLIILLHSESPIWKQSKFWASYQLSLAPSFFLDKIVIILTVCYYHLIYELLIELTLCTCQNVKELFAQSRGYIWSLSDSNWIQIHNHLIRKRTINHYWVITTELSYK